MKSLVPELKTKDQLFMETTLRTELESLIARYNQENNNPANSVLAQYLSASLTAFDSVLSYQNELSTQYTLPAIPAESMAGRLSLTTLDEAVSYLLPRFEGMEKYMQKSEDEFTAFCHSELSGGIGMKIQRELKLWVVESALHQYFLRKHNLFHLDEMSDLIIRGVHQKFTQPK